jgi:hypothetical protein
MRGHSKHFWHPVNALVEESGGWRLEALDERTLGLILPLDDGRYQAWLRDGDRGVPVATAESLPTAAKRLWNAAHPDAAL